MNKIKKKIDESTNKIQELIELGNTISNLEIANKREFQNFKKNIIIE